MATCRLAVAVCRGMYVAADQAADSIGELPWISRRIGALNILINAVTDIDFQIDVANRDYHQLSRFEIGGDKRISQQLSVRDTVCGISVCGFYRSPSEYS